MAILAGASAARGDEAVRCAGLVLPLADAADCTRAIEGGQIRRDAVAAVHRNRGDAFRAAGDPGRALADYDAAIRVHPGDLEAHRRRGDLLHDMFKYREAAKAYTQALALAPNDVALLTRRGMAWRSVRENEAAIADFTAALALDPSPLLYRERAQSLAADGKRDRALADFGEAARLDPADAWSLTRRAALQYSHDDWPAAVAEANAALQRNSSFGPAYQVRGEALARLGDLAHAIADLSDAIRLDPRDYVTYLSRADAYRQAGRDDLALADLDAASALFPDIARIHGARADFLIARGRHANALPSLDRRIELAGWEDPFVQRAKLHLALGDRQRAIVDYGNAIRAAPTTMAHRRARAALYEEAGDFARAFEDHKAIFFHDLTVASLWRLWQGWQARRRADAKAGG